MKKVVHIQNIEDQDQNRREELRRMLPAERMSLLVKFRDQAFPASPLKRVVQKRDLSF